MQMNKLGPDEFSQYPWYVGAVCRDTAEKILHQNGKIPGTFLVRKALPITVPASYRISVLTSINGKFEVVHYKIFLQSGFYRIHGARIFTTIPHLIDWYSKNSDELPVNFTKPYDQLSQRVSSYENSHLVLPQIDRSHIKTTKKIFSGRSSGIEVWRGFLQSASTEVVVKFRPASQDELGSKKLILEEAATLLALRHERVLSMIGIATNEEPYCIVSNYHENGDLLSYLLRENMYEISTHKAYEIAIEIAEGLRHVSRKNYVHRNLRASNVLLDGGLSCRLTGFSHAVTLNQEGVYYALEGDRPFEPSSCRWMALESALKKKFSSASDIWSFAVLLFEIFTKGEMPYSDLLTPLVTQMVEAGHRLHQAAGIPDNIYDVMAKCWDKNADKRPFIDEIISSLQDCLKKDTHLYHDLI